MSISALKFCSNSSKPFVPHLEYIYSIQYSTETALCRQEIRTSNHMKLMELAEITFTEKINYNMRKIFNDIAARCKCFQQLPNNPFCSQLHCPPILYSNMKFISALHKQNCVRTSQYFMYSTEDFTLLLLNVYPIKAPNLCGTILPLVGFRFIFVFHTSLATIEAQFSQVTFFQTPYANLEIIGKAIPTD